SDFLRDHSADREAEHVNSLQAQRPDEGDSVSAHLLERGRHLAGAAGYAGVVEQDHLTVASQAIRHRRVPIIHGADVVLVKDDRHTAGLAESAIREADSVSLYELWRRGLVGMHHNSRSFEPPLIQSFAIWLRLPAEARKGWVIDQLRFSWCR